MKMGNKSQYVMPEVQYEQTELCIQEFKDLVWSFGYQPIPELMDVDLVTEYIKMAVPKKDRYLSVLDTTEGRMYIMGYISGQVSMFLEQEAEDFGAE